MYLLRNSQKESLIARKDYVV